MKTYEAVVILNERQVDDGGEELSRDFASHVESLGGRILQNNNMGRRYFARPIKKQKSGIYLNFIFEINPSGIKLVSERYSLNPAVFRVGILNQEEGVPAKS